MATAKPNMVPITVRVPDLLHGQLRTIVRSGRVNTLRDLVEQSLRREVEAYESQYGKVVPVRRHLRPGRRVQARQK